MARIYLENVAKKFGNNVAVKDLSLEIPDKKFIVLLGPSGCGKTTTLNMIAGLERQTTGHIYFDDKLVDDLPPEKRDVAMVFQTFALYPHMTVYDNIVFPLRIKKMPKQDIKVQAEEVLEMLGIERFRDRKPHELSGGERQRVALGKAIIRKPKVFLLDEPLSNLDAVLRVSMRVELKRLHRKLKKTFVYVTHDQAEAMTMADGVAVMNKGEMQQYGRSDEIYFHPTNRFVASFVGSPMMNFIEGTLQMRGGEILFESAAFTCTINGSLAKLEEFIKSDVTLGIRPGDITVSREAIRGFVGGKVFMVEPLGSDVILSLQIPGIDTLVKARAKTDMAADVNDKVYVYFPEDKVHLFDKKNEKALQIRELTKNS